MKLCATVLEVNESDMIDIITLYMYTGEKSENKKTSLWKCFGEQIVENIKESLKDKSLDNGYVMCERCGERFKIKTANSNQKYCDKCAEIVKKEQKKAYKKRQKISRGKNVKKNFGYITRLEGCEK